MHIRKTLVPRQLLTKAERCNLFDMHERITPCPIELKPRKSEEVERYRAAIQAIKQRQST
jgi:hypothetical protein